MIRNDRSIVYYPIIVRSKAPDDYGRRFTVWNAEVRGFRWQIGALDDLLEHGRERRFDIFRYLGGDYQPRRVFRYYSL